MWFVSFFCKSKHSTTFFTAAKFKKFHTIFENIGDHRAKINIAFGKSGLTFFIYQGHLVARKLAYCTTLSTHNSVCTRTRAQSNFQNLLVER